MKRILFFVMLCIVSFQTFAIIDMEPANQTRTVSITADRSALPAGNYYVFNEELVAFNNQDYGKYGRSGFVCKSSTDSKNGMCSTSQRWGFVRKETNISLRFTESRTGISRDLIVKGYGIFPFQNGSACSTYRGPVEFGSVSMTRCEDNTFYAGYRSTLYFDQSELSKLPVGGIWTAQLLLDYLQWKNVYKATYTVNFKINLTDKKNIQVWLPDFGKGSPQIDLNITPFHGGGLKGQNVVNMCFYDGYSTNSSHLQLRFYDDDGSDSGTDLFKLTSADGIGKLPYKVSLAFGGGAAKTIINNRALVIEGNIPVNWARILAVSLPDIPIPVLCWPATLTLNANLPVSQPANDYTGRLIVAFTPDSASL
ncbi:CfaE/CblD family pilus tip adhesin [Escherichia coli]|uniref:CfaE/CblD family pilus tip adhesin n=1 Tax=Escherichia coli TaxID=562 RepID=UPI00287A6676|nr:CfaE/CblD family pilus tip adhesin [Escherichia coli]MDS1577319.1 CfaE/CblD family pilus tip adhesin [Escherichia coli]MDS1605762.1 CfaE/CblD family pilus tip adhesin [Escherichia coli]MDS1643572.1 CfaE/CblD family pilus tip adhesin [Escherichia coli]